MTDSGLPWREIGLSEGLLGFVVDIEGMSGW
jgi:hypothetical protein